MTGTVEWSTLLWIVGLVLGVAGTSLEIGRRIVVWVTGEFAKRDQALEDAEAAGRLQVAAVDARAKSEEAVIAKSVSDHKLYAAETYATKAGLEGALNRVHDALDKLTDRIDTLITQSSRAPGSPTRRP